MVGVFVVDEEMAVSFMTAAPEIVAVAAGDLAGIGSALGAANAAAALPTAEVAAAAADEVSIQIASMLGAYAAGIPPTRRPGRGIPVARIPC